MTNKELKEARIKMGLTQQKLAELMGTTQQSVYRMESGNRQPTKQHAATIRVMLFIFERGLLDEFLKYCEEENGK